MAKCASCLQLLFSLCSILFIRIAAFQRNYETKKPPSEISSNKFGQTNKTFGNLRLGNWLSWDLVNREPSKMPSKIAVEIAQLLRNKDKSLFERDITRIDVVYSNNAVNSRNVGTAHGHYNWAWSSHGCGGLRDSWLLKSNGLKMFKQIERDYMRLKRHNLIYRGGVSIDIGAHIGDSTIPLALLSNMTIAFDPSESVFPILDVNARINPHLNIHAYPYGVSSEDGEMTFAYGQLDGFAECNGGVETQTTQSNNRIRHVKRPVVNLQTFVVKTFGVDVFTNISMIKIDAEGFDHYILSSLAAIIANLPRKPCVQVEYFAEFRRIVNDDGTLGPNSRMLFLAIESLPGNYTAFCINQGNNDQRGPIAGLEMKKILVEKRSADGAISAAVEDSSPLINCEDFILVPAMHPYISRHRGYGIHGTSKVWDNSLS